MIAAIKVVYFDALCFYFPVTSYFIEHVTCFLSLFYFYFFLYFFPVAPTSVQTAFYFLSSLVWEGKNSLILKQKI